MYVATYSQVIAHLEGTAHSNVSVSSWAFSVTHCTLDPPPLRLVMFKLVSPSVLIVPEPS